MMRFIFALFAISLLSMNLLIAQNPFKKLGVDVGILTLSQGKYIEFIPYDSIQHIGSVVINIKTRHIVELINTDSVELGYNYRPDVASRWMSPDPLTEEFPDWTPYNFCKGNPIVRIDPDGMLDDWYQDVDGTYQYDPNVKSQANLKDGQKYIAPSFEEKDSKGVVTTSYNKDGSIFYKNETEAYNRMWSNATRKSDGPAGKEIAGVFTKSGILVLPDYLNEANKSKLAEYGYSFKINGSTTLLTNGEKSYNIFGLIHTHQDKTADATPSFYDAKTAICCDLGVSRDMGGLPNVVIGWDNKIHDIYFVKPNKQGSIDWGGLTRTQLLKGTPLIPFLSTYPTRKK